MTAIAAGASSTTGTFAVLVTAPIPVITEQPMSAATSSGISSRTLIAQLAGTTISGA